MANDKKQTNNYLSILKKYGLNDFDITKYNSTVLNTLNKIEMDDPIEAITASVNNIRNNLGPISELTNKNFSIDELNYWEKQFDSFFSLNKEMQDKLKNLASNVSMDLDDIGMEKIAKSTAIIQTGMSAFDNEMMEYQKIIKGMKDPEYINTMNEINDLNNNLNDTHNKQINSDNIVKDVMGDTVEETIENTTENVLEETVEAAGETIAGEVIEETGEKIIKEVTGINVELDGLNKKKTPKKLKKGTKKYKAKTSTINNEIYDRLDNSRYWAVDFPGSNGDFAVHGPNGTKRLEKESIDQQRRKRKYEQTRQKYERKQQQRNQQKQKDFVDNTIHIDDGINLDDINKQWYESKQKEFEQRQKEIDDYFENNADIDPEDVLKDDYEPDVNKFTDDIDTLEKNFEQSKDFDINKGIDDTLDAANKTVESTVREGGSISKYLKEFNNMGFFDKVQTLGAAAGAVSEYKNARRQGHGVVSSVARAGVDFALGEAMGLYYPLFLLAKEAPGMIVKGSEMLYKENRKMNSMANQQIFGGAQFQDTQQLATMRQSGLISSPL